MKSITNLLADFAPAIIFPAYFLFRKRKKTGIVLLVMLSISFSSCFLHYYKTNTKNRIDAATLQQLQLGDKYFMLHTGGKIFALKNPKINNETLDSDLDSVDQQLARYFHPDTSRSNRFRVADKEYVLYAVHLYAQNTSIDNYHINLPLNVINRVDVYQLDKELTNTSKVLSIIGVSLLTAAVVGLIAAAAACNCPQVYTYSGKDSTFNGGLYSGAIYASLERTDYMPLHALRPNGDKLRLQIGSVEGEEQIINELHLLNVTHPKGSMALADRYGNVLLYHQAVVPERAWVDDKTEVTSKIIKADEAYYSFSNQPAGQHTSDITMEFKKPAGVSTGRLIIRAKNSAWSGYLFHEFNSLFGNYYPAWTQQKDMADPAVMRQWQTDQSLPLRVSVKKGDSWQYVDYFVTPGNTAARNMIMKINLAGFENTEHLQVRMETAFMFWDLDYAGMDFAEENQYTATILPAESILKSDSSSQREQLKSSDKNYTHLINTEFITATYEAAPVLPGQESTYFLVSSGYYHINKTYTGKPQVARLKSFLEKGAFDKFSRQKFIEIENMQAEVINRTPHRYITRKDN